MSVVLNDNAGPSGFLKIWRKKGNLVIPHAMDNNIILKVYRDNLAQLANDDDGFDSGGDDLFSCLIPVRMSLDNQGSETLTDGTEHVFVPSWTDSVDDTDPNYYIKDFNSKGFGEAPNIIKMITRIRQNEANGKTFSRAMLISKTGEPVALKCFESLPKKQTWEFIFEWSIAY